MNKLDIIMGMAKNDLGIPDREEDEHRNSKNTNRKANKKKMQTSRKSRRRNRK